jgi:hypothetical protein
VHQNGTPWSPPPMMAGFCLEHMGLSINPTFLLALTLTNVPGSRNQESTYLNPITSNEFDWQKDGC